MNDPPPADELLQRLRRFKSDYFPHHQQRFQDLVAQGQHPKTLFIGCSDSRLVPYLLTDAAPGELFIVRGGAQGMAQARRRGAAAGAGRPRGHAPHRAARHRAATRAVDGLPDGEARRGGGFVPASIASNSGTGPYQPYVEHDGQLVDC